MLHTQIAFREIDRAFPFRVGVTDEPPCDASIGFIVPRTPASPPLFSILFYPFYACCACVVRCSRTKTTQQQWNQWRSTVTPPSGTPCPRRYLRSGHRRPCPPRRPRCGRPPAVASRLQTGRRLGLAVRVPGQAAATTTLRRSRSRISGGSSSSSTCLPRGAAAAAGRCRRLRRTAWPADR